MVVSFSELSINVRAAARTLKEAGLKCGGRCAILSHNSVAYVYASLAVMESGATSINMSWRQPDKVNLALLDELRSGLTSELFIALAELARQELDLRCLLCESICATPLIQSPPLVKLRDTPSPTTLPPDDPECPAIVFFTGGTTGSPKAVPHTHATLLFLADSYLREHGAPLNPHVIEHPGSVCFTPFVRSVGIDPNLFTTLPHPANLLLSAPV
jgi:fatty-acyl-CoA synthase